MTPFSSFQYLRKGPACSPGGAAPPTASVRTSYASSASSACFWLGGSREIPRRRCSSSSIVPGSNSTDSGVQARARGRRARRRSGRRADGRSQRRSRLLRALPLRGVPRAGLPGTFPRACSRPSSEASSSGDAAGASTAPADRGKPGPSRTRAHEREALRPTARPKSSSASACSSRSESSLRPTRTPAIAETASASASRPRRSTRIASVTASSACGRADTSTPRIAAVELSCGRVRVHVERSLRGTPSTRSCEPTSSGGRQRAGLLRRAVKGRRAVPSVPQTAREERSCRRQHRTPT